MTEAHLKVFRGEPGGASRYDEFEGQYDDTYTPSVRMLFDEEEPPVR